MKWPCQKVSLDKVPVGPQGMAQPLCDSCISKDCSNPIEHVEISIMGVSRKHKVFNSGGSPRFVLACDGYVKKKDS